MDKKEELLNVIVENLPPIVIRNQVGELTFGLVSPKSLSNADAEGTGPAEVGQLYGKVVYPRQSFMAWLKQKLFKNEENNNGKEKNGKNGQPSIRGRLPKGM